MVKRRWRQHKANHLFKRHKNPGVLDYNQSPSDPFYGLPIRTRQDQGDPEDVGDVQYCMNDMNDREGVISHITKYLLLGCLLPYKFWKVAAVAVLCYE